MAVTTGGGLQTSFVLRTGICVCVCVCVCGNWPYLGVPCGPRGVHDCAHIRPLAGCFCHGACLPDGHEGLKVVHPHALAAQGLQTPLTGFSRLASCWTVQSAGWAGLRAAGAVLARRAQQTSLGPGAIRDVQELCGLE